MNTQYTMVDSSNNYFSKQQAICAMQQAYSTIDYRRR